MPKHHKPTRILAIDPGIRGMGFAVFEEENLIRYGVKNLRKQKFPEMILAKGKYTVFDLIQRFNPRVLALGKVTHPTNKKNPVFRKLASNIRRIAKKNKIKI